MCGEDTHSPENLTRVIWKDGTGSGFYDSDPVLPPCDSLLCSECVEKYSEEALVVEEVGVLETYIASVTHEADDARRIAPTLASPTARKLVETFVETCEDALAGLKEHVRSGSA